jgi:hypothetical protein
MEMRPDAPRSAPRLREIAADGGIAARSVRPPSAHEIVIDPRLQVEKSDPKSRE